MRSFSPDDREYYNSPKPGEFRVYGNQTVAEPSQVKLDVMLAYPSAHRVQMVYISRQAAQVDIDRLYATDQIIRNEWSDLTDILSGMDSEGRRYLDPVEA